MQAGILLAVGVPTIAELYSGQVEVSIPTQRIIEFGERLSGARNLDLITRVRIGRIKRRCASLRGIACLGVVAVHFCVVFWGIPAISAGFYNGPPELPAAVQFPLLQRWSMALGPLNTGAIGVALFFLISGFVIPVSLERYSAPAFIVAQLIGAAAATALFRWLVPALPDVARTVVVPRSDASRADSPRAT